MGIHHKRTIEPQEGRVSSALLTTYEAAADARRLEDFLAPRVGGRDIAREKIARDTKVPLGTLENLGRGRIKQVAAWVRDSLRAAVIRQLESELHALEHELSVLRQTGADPRSTEVDAVVSHLAAARQALGLKG